MKRALTTYAASCLLTSGLLHASSAVVFASPLANRFIQDAPHTVTRPKPVDSRPIMAKPAQETAVARAKPKRDAPGKRFWGRIMDNFRDIHSAEKKPK